MKTEQLQRGIRLAQGFQNMLTMYGDNDEAVRSSCLHFQKKIDRNKAQIDSAKTSFSSNRFLKHD